MRKQNLMFWFLYINNQHNPYFSMLEKNGRFFKFEHLKREKRSRIKTEVPQVYEINTIVWIHSRKIIDLKSFKRTPSL